MSISTPEDEERIRKQSHESHQLKNSEKKSTPKPSKSYKSTNNEGASSKIECHSLNRSQSKPKTEGQIRKSSHNTFQAHAMKENAQACLPVPTSRSKPTESERTSSKTAGRSSNLSKSKLSQSKDYGREEVKAISETKQSKSLKQGNEEQTSPVHQKVLQKSLSSNSSKCGENTTASIKSSIVMMINLPPRIDKQEVCCCIILD